MNYYDNILTLREATGAGIDDCFKAYLITNDLEKAKDWIREEGLPVYYKSAVEENARKIKIGRDIGLDTPEFRADVIVSRIDIYDVVDGLLLHQFVWGVVDEVRTKKLRMKVEEVK